MKAHKSGILGLALVAAVLGMTACEDKDEIVFPDDPITIAVSPAGPITLAVGQTASVVGVVSGGPAGTVRTATYTSSNPAIARVDAASGVVTAVAPGTATITATSTADASVRANVQVIVTAAGGGGTPVPPTVSIRSVNQGGTNVPVQTNNVFGQIDIIANLEVPTGTAISRVEFLVDNQVVCTQTFGAGTGAEEVEVAASQAAQELVCSVNTAEVTAAGAPRFPNGPHTISVRVIGPQGTTTASTSQTYTFNNVNRLDVTTAPAGITTTRGPAIGPDGLSWRGGDVTVTIRPVLFTGGTVGRVTVTADPVNDRGGASTGTVTLVDSTLENGVFSVTFPSGASQTPAAGTGLGLVEDTVQITATSVTSAGSAGPGIAAGSGTGLRLDNWAPRITRFATTSTRWVNEAFRFADSLAARDSGVNRNTVTFRAGTSTSNLQAVTTGADLSRLFGESATNATLILEATVTDALSNSRTVYFSGDPTAPTTSAASATPAIGVDTGDPTIAFTAASLADRAAADPGTFFEVSFTDDRSGPAPSPVRARGTRSAPGVSGAAACEVGTFSTTAGCGFVGEDSRTEFIGPTGVTDTAFPADETNAPGYYTYEAFAVDAAGNASPTITRTVVYDNVAPTATVSSPSLTLTGGTTAAFTVLATDNLDLAAATPSITYSVAGFELAYPSTVLGTGFDATFDQTANRSVEVSPFIRCIEATAAGVPGGACDDADVVEATVSDQAGNAFDATSPISAFVTDTATSYAAGTDTVRVYDFLLTADGSTTDTVCQDTDADGCTSNPTTTTLVAVARGTAGVFRNPFTSVRFYRRATPGSPASEATFIGTGSLTVTEGATGRLYSYTLTYDPTAAAPGVEGVFAIGVDGTGRALASNEVTITRVVD